MMVVVAAAVVGGRRRRRKRGRTSGGTRVRRRGEWEGGEKVMVNTARMVVVNGRYRDKYKKEAKRGEGEKKGGNRREKRRPPLCMMYSRCRPPDTLTDTPTDTSTVAPRILPSLVNGNPAVAVPQRTTTHTQTPLFDIPTANLD